MTRTSKLKFPKLLLEAPISNAIMAINKALFHKEPALSSNDIVDGRWRKLLFGDEIVEVRMPFHYCKDFKVF